MIMSLALAQKYLHENNQKKTCVEIQATVNLYWIYIYIIFIQ